MGLSMKRMILLAKEEAVAGTDPVPTPVANAILCRGLTPTPINAEYIQRELLRGYKGNFTSIAVGVHRRFQFEVELAGSGAAGTAPKYGPLLKCCGFSETVAAAVSVTYAPISTGEKTVTLYAYLDGLLFKLTYGKGTVAFALDAKGIPVMKFDVMGEYSPMTDVPFPTTQDYTGFQVPKPVGKINTPTFNFFGVAAVCKNLNLDVAAQLVYRDLINNQGPISPDRKPAGSSVFELGLAAAKQWDEVARLGTTGAMQLIHGTTAGNIVTINAPALQLNALDIQNQDEVAMVSAGFTVNPSAVGGNDEMTIVCT